MQGRAKLQGVVVDLSSSSWQGRQAKLLQGCCKVVAEGTRRRGTVPRGLETRAGSTRQRVGRAS